jgi:hypothetical protein
MRLSRLGTARFTRSDSGLYYDEGYKSVCFVFQDCGLGERNTSKFEVDVTWKDVEALIKEFAKANEPNAVTLQKDRSFATKLRRIAKVKRPRISN